jgi:putative transposase
LSERSDAGFSQFSRRYLIYWNWVGGIFGLKAEEVLSPGKQPRRIEARSGACFYAVRALGMTTVEVSHRLGITPSAVTKAVYRGEKLANAKGFQMISAAK